MAEPTKAPKGKTIKVFGKQMPKTTVYAGAAAVAGIVVYAWWTKSGGLGGEEEEELLFDEFGNPIAGPTPGTAPPFTDSNREVSVGTGFETNADWSQFAISHLQGLGLDAPTVSSAIGKFLQRKPLNPIEADLVGQAVAVAGWPPDDRPWTIIPVTSTGPPAEVGLTAPANFRATGGVGYADLSWSPVTGAASYETQLSGLAWRSVGTATSQRVTFPANSRGNFNFKVRAVGPANTKGPSSSASATVQNTGGGALPAPVARVTSTTRTAVSFSWNAVPGARTYLVTREGGGRGINRPGRSHTSGGLRPNTQYTFIIRAVDRSGKGGTSQVLTAKTRA